MGGRGANSGVNKKSSLNVGSLQKKYDALEQKNIELYKSNSGFFINSGGKDHQQWLKNVQEMRTIKEQINQLHSVEAKRKRKTIVTAPKPAERRRGFTPAAKQKGFLVKRKPF